MAEIERGLQWWVRYALVPVLGSGGLAAAVVAYINRPAAAHQTVEAFRDRFPDLGFLPMSTAEISNGRAAYAVVMARGLESQGEAARVARLARECGVAPDAYFKREP